MERPPDPPIVETALANLRKKIKNPLPRRAPPGNEAPDGAIKVFVIGTVARNPVAGAAGAPRSGNRTVNEFTTLPR